jgi:thiol-disulfide isomerase/thioredoxin
MTAATTATLILLSVLTCLNLLLTYGVIRRLRTHEERLADASEPGMRMSDSTPRVGTPIPEFRVPTLDGGEVTREQLAVGERYVGFFSVHCPPCRERLPEFVRFVSENAVPRDPLVVISGMPDERRDDMVAAVGGAARLVVDDHDPGTLEQLFRIERLPCLLMLRDGVVVANATIIGQLPGTSHT